MGIVKNENADYIEWIKNISVKFRKSQLKAASKVNTEMLKFYWNIGKDICHMESENSYGSGFYNKISRDLKKELPDVKSFSVTNLKYMGDASRLFYFPDAACPVPHTPKKHAGY